MKTIKYNSRSLSRW